MIDINPEFVDVDFEAFFDDPHNEFTRGDLGELCFDSMGDAYENVRKKAVLSDKQIRSAIDKINAAEGGLDRLVTRIYNQKKEGSCVANACAQAHEINQALQVGKDKVIHLSAISLYKRIGRSASSGAMVSNGIKEMKSRGILPLNNAANKKAFDVTMPNTGFSTRFPNNWEATGAMFTGLEVTPIRSLGGLLSALCDMHPVIVGREGHSICYTRPMWQKNRYLVKYANSWGNWGDEGFGYDSLSQIKKSAKYAFALRSVTVRNPE